MIAVDTSALMAIVLKEPEADACKAALAAEDEILISAGTVAEALIVAARRNVDTEVGSIIDRLGFEIVAVTPAAGYAGPIVLEIFSKDVPDSLYDGDLPAVVHRSRTALTRLLGAAPR